MSLSARPFVVMALATALIGTAAPPATSQAAADRTASPADGIHAAARAGDLARLKSLLAGHPALIGSRDGKGLTPLHAACQEKRADVVAFLLAAGADVKAVDAEKYTPLHRAAFAGDAECCRLLLEAGADPKAVESMGRTPLVLACGFGLNMDAVKRLVEGGSDVNHVLPGGDNVLLASMMFGKPEIIDFLLRSGARLAEDDRSTWMGLMVSTRSGQEKVFRLALQAAEKKGMTLSQIVSLHAAADQGRTAFVALLLDRGAKIDEPDRMGRTAWNLARDGKHPETAELLRSRGASQAEARFPPLRGPWLGQPDPGDTPSVFAPGIVSGVGAESEHSPVAFTPDGNEAYWTKKFRGPILHSRQVDGLWTAPRPAAFASPWGDGEPFITPDGKRLYFLSFRPLQPGGRSDKENIWYVDRRGGDWSDPKPESAAVNAFDHHWLFSAAADGTLYFSAAREGGLGGRDIYVSRLVDGTHGEPYNIGPAINTAGDEHMPFIAPDGSYLLFARREGSGNGGPFRLLISYRDGRDWTKPVGLGEAIDSVQMALCPMVTPDGQFMFFLGRGDIYWVRAGFIEALRPKR